MSRNLAELLASSVAARPAALLAVDDERTTLEQAYEQATAAAAGLHAAGHGPGTRLALVMTNSLEFLVAWMAGVLSGAEVALVNPAYPDDLLREMFAVLAPRAVLVDAAGRGRDHGVAVLDASEVRSAGLRDDRGRPLPAGGTPLGIERAASDIAGFMHTSGTSGAPKFCAQSHRYHLALGDFVRELFEIGPDDAVFAPLPLFHVNPLGYGLLGALSGSADFHSARRFSVSGYWPRVVRDRASVLILHGAPLSLLKQHADPAGARGHRVRSSFFGDHDFMERFSVPGCVTAYGSTEAGGIAHTRRWQRGEAATAPEGQLREAGSPRPGFEWRLDAGAETDGGAPGEILIRAADPDELFSGYATRDGVVSRLDPDGWFATGDLGRRDADGSLVFVERAAESVRVKGEYIPLDHLEGRLAGALGRSVCAWKRVGVDGDELVVYVEGEPDLDRYALVRDELPGFMRPAAFAVVEALPRDTGVGKVQRRRLGETAVRRWVESR